MFLQIYKILSNFDFNALICDATLFAGKNSTNIGKSNRVFPGKGTYLDSPVVCGFYRQLLIFFDLGHLQGETGGQSYTKSANFGSVSFS